MVTLDCIAKIAFIIDSIFNQEEYEIAVDNGTLDNQINENFAINNPQLSDFLISRGTTRWNNWISTMKRQIAAIILDSPNWSIMCFGISLAEAIQGEIRSIGAGEGSDDFYDKDGTITRYFYDHLSAEAKSVFEITVPGNHDYFYAGDPLLAKKGECSA